MPPCLAHQGRRRGGYSPGVGASAVPAGGAIHSALGRLGHQPAGTMTGARGARWTGTGWGGCHARSNCARSAPPGWGELTGPDAPAESQEALARSRALGTTTPFGESRGGTPTGERIRKGASRARWCGGYGSAFVGVPLPLFIGFSFGETGVAKRDNEAPPLDFLFPRGFRASRGRVLQ